MAVLNEDALIALLQKRDESALAEIRKRYGRLCFQLAYSILGSREDAEECVNDLLMNVWRNPPQTQHLCAYLTAAVRRIALNRCRDAAAQKRGGKQFKAALEELEQLTAAGSDVEAALDQRALARALDAFLDTLPPRTRRIFLQRYWQAASVREIAVQNRMTQSAVKISLMRTRNKLKAYLEQEGLL